MQSFPHVNKFTQKREIKCAVLSAPPSTIPPSTLTVCVCATIAPKIASQYQNIQPFLPLFSILSFSKHIPESDEVASL